MLPAWLLWRAFWPSGCWTALRLRWNCRLSGAADWQGLQSRTQEPVPVPVMLAWCCGRAPVRALRLWRWCWGGGAGAAFAFGGGGGGPPPGAPGEGDPGGGGGGGGGGHASNTRPPLYSDTSSSFEK